MSTKKRVNGPKLRGQTAKAQSAEGLAEVAHQPALAQTTLLRRHIKGTPQEKEIYVRLAFQESFD
jgi:hypothetical protein